MIYVLKDFRKNMTGKTFVLVDGSNIIHANIGSRKYFSVNRLKNVIEKIKKLGYTYKVGMKGGTYNYIMTKASDDEISEEDKNELKNLVETLEVSLLNSSKDDRWIHLAAIEFDAYILSHDRFRDEIKYWEDAGKPEIAEEVKNRRIELEFFDELPIFDLPDISGMAIVVTEEGEVVVVKDELSEPLHSFKEETIVIETLEYEHAVVKTDSRHIKSLIRIDSDEIDWFEFDLPLETKLGRAFFAELLSVSEATTDILKKISREHFSVQTPGTITGGKSYSQLLIKDFDSTNGTQVNGARVGTIGHITNIDFGNTDQPNHPVWPSILLGSRLMEIKIGAVKTDVSSSCFDECSCHV